MRVGQAVHIQTFLRSSFLLLSLALAACSGSYDGNAAGDSRADGGSGASPRSMEDLYAQRVQPSLAFCRSCHVPGGVADVEKGRDFMPGNDLASLKASWERLGGNASAVGGTSRILLMASRRRRMPAVRPGRRAVRPTRRWTCC